MKGLDAEVVIDSILDIESSVHREPPVLTYQIRTLRSSYPSFTLASWH